MELEPWMLGVYMLCGILFFLIMLIIVTPKMATRRIMKELRGETGKAIMHEIVITALESMNDEMEIPTGEVDEMKKPIMVKTTVGAYLMSSIGSSVVKHFKMTFLGEKGNMAREMQNAEMGLMMQGLPEQFQQLMPMIFPMIKKYPLLGGLIGMALPMMAKQMNPQGTGQNGYGNVGNSPIYRGV